MYQLPPLPKEKEVALSVNLQNTVSLLFNRFINPQLKFIKLAMVLFKNMKASGQMRKNQHTILLQL